MACGAEALSRQNEDLAEANSWSLAKNFKLRLHPAAVVEKNHLVLDGAPDLFPCPIARTHASTC